MYIVVKGNLEAAKLKRAKMVEFHCNMCGCIWRASKDEYKDISNPMDGCEYMCNCPTCGERSYSSKLW